MIHFRNNNKQLKKITKQFKNRRNIYSTDIDLHPKSETIRMYNYYISSKKTVVKSRIQRSYSYFGITLAESELYNMQQAKSLLSPSYLSSIFFSLSARHIQSTYQFPIWHLPLASPPLALHFVISDRKEEKHAGERRRRNLISGAQSPLCFPIPRSSANVDCGRRGRSRVFAPPTDRVNTLIDAKNRERQTDEGGREIVKKNGGKLNAIERADERSRTRGRVVKWEEKVEEMLGRGRKMAGRSVHKGSQRVQVTINSINIAKGSLFMVI